MTQREREREREGWRERERERGPTVWCAGDVCVEGYGVQGTFVMNETQVSEFADTTGHQVPRP